MIQNMQMMIGLLVILSRWAHETASGESRSPRGRRNALD
jgi:hypothetical protein